MSEWSWKCSDCGKVLTTDEEYKRETEDVSWGFEWTIEHLPEYCNKEKVG